MKKRISFALTLVLALGLLCGCVSLKITSSPDEGGSSTNTAASASTAGEAVTPITKNYKQGDTVDDFTLTLSDGSSVTLSDLLAEKKVVVINLWASWCGPCRNEFPHMEEVAAAMADDVAVLALSAEASDTDEFIVSFQQENKLGTLYMGRDTLGFSKAISQQFYPTTLVIDRNSVIGYIQVGALPDADSFTRLFEVYTADDYTDSVLLSSIPTA